jgi:hypothetical protein
MQGLLLGKILAMKDQCDDLAMVMTEKRKTSLGNRNRK